MNEGQVRVGGRTVEIGRLRSWVSLGAGVALGAGLAIGVVSAVANSGPTSDLIALQRTGTSARFAAGRITEIDAGTITVVIPLPRPTATTADGATVTTSGDQPIQTRTIRLDPQTRSPAQRPRTGDFLLAVGKPEADGSLTARAVAVRRPGQLVRRQAALTTTPAPVPA